MFRTTLRAGLLFGLFALSPPVHAVAITGELFTDGNFTTNTGNLGSATSLNIPLAWTAGGTGSYAALNGGVHEVSYATFTFNPSLPGPVNPLWWFTAGSVSYSFSMTGIEVASQSWDALELIGSGTLYITGYDPTPGLWYFSTTCKNETCTGRFRFSTGAANIPEPGSLALLGLGLLGLSLTRRRRA